jgi:hypothetical protein
MVGAREVSERMSWIAKSASVTTKGTVYWTVGVLVVLALLDPITADKELETRETMPAGALCDFAKYGGEYFGNKCYFVLNKTINNTAAEAACVDLGGHLAAPRTQEEFDVITRVYKSWLRKIGEDLTHNSGGIYWAWVGLHQSQPDEWISAVDQAVVNIPAQWWDERHFLKNEDIGPREGGYDDCVVIKASWSGEDMSLNDYSCRPYYDTKYPICSINSLPLSDKA